MESIEIEYKGSEWLCEYEYDPPQKADDTDPAIPGIATIFHLYVRDCGELCAIDLIDFINVHTLHDLEKEIEESYEDY